MPGGTSAYLVFANANRNEVREDLLKAQGSEGSGKIGIAQLGKELGARWKRLSEEEKERYKTLAKEQNEKKAAERKESPDGEAEGAQGKGGVQAKPPGLPTAVVKRLVLSDPDLKRISAPALNLVINSAERFIGLMAQRSREVAITSGKKTIRMQDILAVAREGGWRMAPILDHLKEVSPLIEAQDAKQQTNSANPEAEAGVNLKEEAKAAPAVRRITEFFGGAP